LEKKVTISYWTSVFKSLGIYNENYHKKYRKYIHNRQYKVYIKKVAEDMYKKLFNELIRLRIIKVINKGFPRPLYSM